MAAGATTIGGGRRRRPWEAIAGMGAEEIGLDDALADGSLTGRALVLLVGLPLIVAGSAGYMTPLLGGAKPKGSTDA